MTLIPKTPIKTGKQYPILEISLLFTMESKKLGFNAKADTE
jgi:hypothetical protein